MIAMTQSRTKRLTAIHGWSGVVLGLLLYVVIVTGAVAVFAHEIGIWSQGGVHAEHGLSGKVDRHLRKSAREIDPKFYEEIFVSNDENGALRLSFRTHERNPATGNIEDLAINLKVDPQTGETLERKEGFIRDIAGPDRAAALERFLVDIHVRLYVPAPWGLLLTGILGLMMMAAAVTGFLMHKHLIRDAFLPARGRERLVSARDRHVLAASWSLPFGILLAFTGAFFSFALSLGVPVLATIAFGGDQEALVEMVLSTQGEIDQTPAPLASLDYILADTTERVGNAPRTLLIEHYGIASARVTAFHQPASGDLTSQNLLFDGVSRAFLGVKPALGQVPSTGSTLVSLMAPLHFGSFSGLISKMIWLALGLAMAYVTATGLLLWTRRREEERVWRRFNRAITITIWGLPIAMIGSTYGFLFTLPAGDTMWWTPASFAVAALASIWMGVGKRDPSATYAKVLGMLCLGLPLFRHVMGGTSWSEALLTGNGIILSIDILLVIAGVLLLRPAGQEALRTGPRVIEAAE
ncbi:MAG: PepSY-associated TM helix domain-containing protein [Pseudomonadota bacterium]